MSSFIQKYQPQVTGVLSGFDRLVLRGTIRILAVASRLMDYLYCIGVRFSEWGQFMEQTSLRVKGASCRLAEELGRPLRYLPSGATPKEPIARAIAQKEGIRQGLICTLTSVEPCRSFQIHRDREGKKVVLVPGIRKCLHVYQYWIDRVFGFMNARIQTWFPFSIQVCLNGREYLARQMDREGIGYERSDNCFLQIEQFARAQELLDAMLRLSWPQQLDRVVRALNPEHWPDCTRPWWWVR